MAAGSQRVDIVALGWPGGSEVEQSPGPSPRRAVSQVEQSPGLRGQSRAALSSARSRRHPPPRRPQARQHLVCSRDRRQAPCPQSAGKEGFRSCSAAPRRWPLPRPASAQPTGSLQLPGRRPPERPAAAPLTPPLLTPPPSAGPSAAPPGLSPWRPPWQLPLRLLRSPWRPPWRLLRCCLCPTCQRLHLRPVPPVLPPAWPLQPARRDRRRGPRCRRRPPRTGCRTGTCRGCSRPPWPMGSHLPPRLPCRPLLPLRRSWTSLACTRPPAWRGPGSGSAPALRTKAPAALGSCPGRPRVRCCSPRGQPWRRPMRRRTLLQPRSHRRRASPNPTGRTTCRRHANRPWDRQPPLRPGGALSPAVAASSLVAGALLHVARLATMGRSGPWVRPPPSAAAVRRLAVGAAAAARLLLRRSRRRSRPSTGARGVGDEGPCHHRRPWRGFRPCGSAAASPCSPCR
mmetsp:Transcript_10096/g.29863  ORF Transcript_10096/g.29863 Transcript_10096/m.29863 type:complete len:457 (-) Transcript_10096:527-1897(-)